MRNQIFYSADAVLLRMQIILIDDKVLFLARISIQMTRISLIAF